MVLQAVDAFLEAGELDEAGRIIDLVAGVAGVGPSAEVELRRARARWQAGDPTGAKVAVEAGLALGAGSRTATEVGLRIEELRHPIRVTFDADRAMSLATETWSLARDVGVDEARARVLLGSAHLVAGSPGWVEHIEGALAQAHGEGDLDTAFEASNALVAAHLLGGDRAVALDAAVTAAELARRHHRRHWEEQFSITANLLALLAGRAGEVAAWGRAFVRPHLTVAVHLAHAVHAIALADLGLGREAATALREGQALDAGDETGASLLCWAEAEAHWLLGQPDRAVDAAEACLRHGVDHFPVRPLAGVAAGLGAVRSGKRARAGRSGGLGFRRGGRAREQGRGRARLVASTSRRWRASRRPPPSRSTRRASRCVPDGAWGRRSAVPGGPTRPASSSSASRLPHRGTASCPWPAGLDARSGRSVTGPATTSGRAPR